MRGAAPGHKHGQRNSTPGSVVSPDSGVAPRRVSSGDGRCQPGAPGAGGVAACAAPRFPPFGRAPGVPASSPEAGDIPRPGGVGNRTRRYRMTKLGEEPELGSHPAQLWSLSRELWSLPSDSRRLPGSLEVTERTNRGDEAELGSLPAEHGSLPAEHGSLRRSSGHFFTRSGPSGRRRAERRGERSDRSGEIHPAPEVWRPDAAIPSRASGFRFRHLDEPGSVFRGPGRRDAASSPSGGRRPVAPGGDREAVTARTGRRSRPGASLRTGKGG